MSSFVRIAFSLSLFCLLLPAIGHAAPAAPAYFSVNQPDGTLVQLRQRGDEWNHWLESANGYAIVQDSATGWYEYAIEKNGKLAASGVAYVPGAKAPESAAPGLRPAVSVSRRGSVYSRAAGEQPGADAGWTPVPVSRTKNIVVILVEFQDQTFTVASPVVTWEGFVFSNAKSVKGFYDDMSRSAMTITPANETYSASGSANDGVIRVQLQPSDFYSGNHCNAYIDAGSDDFEQHSREVSFVESVVSRASSYIDFASYDTNADGNITPNELVVYMITAGYDQSASNSTPSFWAHAWESWIGQGTAHEVDVDGKVLTAWALNGEQYSAGVPMQIGVIVHELGHQMCGLPDLYDTSYTNAGLGNFSVMAGGSWGQNTGEVSGATPVSLDAWSRNYLGWDELEVVTVNGAHTLGTPMDTVNKTLKVMRSDHRSTEYFLIENRYPSGWDLGMAATLDSPFSGGLLILHVDEEIGTPGENNINESGVGAHQGVMAVEANGPHLSLDDTSRGSNETLWFQGNSEYVGDGTFTPTSTPSSAFYDASSSGLSITNIGSAGPTMSATFDVYGGVDAVTVPVGALDLLLD